MKPLRRLWSCGLNKLKKRITNEKKQLSLTGEIVDVTGELVDVTTKEGYVIDYAKGYRLKATPEEKRRQEIERRIIDEWNYPRELIDIEKEVVFGSQRVGRADITVFQNQESMTTARNAYIIVEVKRESRRDGIEQLESYMNATTAEFGIWYNGRDILFLRRLREPNRFQEISKIPRFRERFEDLEKQPLKEALKPVYNLKSRFDEIHNYLYANEGFLKEKLFGEIIKLIFMKIVDEKSPRKEALFWVSEEEYESLLQKGASITFVDRVQRLWTEAQRLYPEMDGELSLKILSVAEIIRRLQDISFSKTQDDIKGTAFQTFIHENMRGDRGEFFTPQPAIELAVGMMEPDYYDAIIDPACGTGRFLIWAMEHVQRKYNLNARKLADYAKAHISGIDINQDLVKVAKMYMVLFEDGYSNVLSANSLLPFSDLSEIAMKESVPKHARPEENKFELILTNPPFGSKGRINDSRILQQFDLAHKWKYNKPRKKWEITRHLLKEQIPEILFIERCWHLLKPNGRMGMVLPDGILTNSTLGYVRQWILNHTQILSVVSLPQETFIPYGAGTKASILFSRKVPLDKIEEMQDADYPVFMAVVGKIGYNVRGRPISKRDVNGKAIFDEQGNPIIDSDIPEIINAYQDFRKTNSVRF